MDKFNIKKPLKRTFLQAFGNEDSNILQKKFLLLKKDTDFENLFNNLSLSYINENYNYKETNYDLIWNYIMAKVLTKLNFYLERVLNNTKKNNKKTQKKIIEKKAKKKENKKKFIFNKSNFNDNNNDNNSCDSDDNNNNPKNNNIHISNNNNHYINEEFYPIIRIHSNIETKNFDLINITGDGNCLYKAISYFLYGTELNYNKIRNKIYIHGLTKLNILPNILIDTEMGPKRIHDYIPLIKNDKFYGGVL